ncbi:MAG: prepilin-type N-terminal cleavage/methylation domain-containing protein [bacterium]
MLYTCNRSGFTLVEVVLVIVIAGILATVALRSAGVISDTAKVEQTKQEMDALVFAIAGNPELHNNGTRSDFGYVGDVGAIPPNLDALYSNPGSYTTWNGPYISNRFTQTADDYKTDAWGTFYTYTGGVDITSTGSGSDIVRKLANSTGDLLINQVSGVVLDADDKPPGTTYNDSVSVRLTVPDGAGAITTKSTVPDAGGYFSFDSILIGNHDIEVIYIPNSDTMRRYVSILPAASSHSQYNLPVSVWGAESGTDSMLSMTSGSDTLFPSTHCNSVSFWLANNTGSPITVSSLTLTWTNPVAYYRYVKWNGITVFDSNNPKAASGEVITFSSPQTINSGETVRIQLETYESQATGGAKVDMTGGDFTIVFSDGSTFDFIPMDCP